MGGEEEVQARRTGEERERELGKKVPTKITQEGGGKTHKGGSDLGSARGDQTLR